MKIKMKMLTIVALLIMVVSCVTTNTSISLPEKYNLDNELTAVKRISAVGAANWDQVDSQSVMFTANGGKFYLLILSRALEAMNSKIGFLGNSVTVQAGYDKIYVGSSSNKRFYPIEKIYELNGVDQVKQIKERLNKN